MLQVHLCKLHRDGFGYSPQRPEIAFLACTPNTCVSEESTSQTCTFPIKALENISEALCSDSAHLEVMTDSVNRLQLYCGHLHRAVTQDLRIATFFQRFQSRPARTSAFVLMYYKKKFVTIRYRERSLKYLGSASLSGMPMLFCSGGHPMMQPSGTIWGRSSLITYRQMTFSRTAGPLFLFSMQLWNALRCNYLL